MCLPAAAIGPLMIASTAVSAVGQIQSGLYASQMARYQAQVSEQNKAIAKEAASDTIARGQDEQRRLGREIALRVGAQTARMGANNVDVTFGSAARVTDDTLLIGREDQAALSENINRQVRSMQTDIWNYESEKRAAKSEAKQAKIGAAFGVASTVLGGATQYSKFKAGQSG